MQSRKQLDITFFWLQAVFTLILIAVCSYKVVVNDPKEQIPKAVYWTELVSLVSTWLTSSGARFSKPDNNVDVDSQTATIVTGNDIQAEQ